LAQSRLAYSQWAREVRVSPGVEARMENPLQNRALVCPLLAGALPITLRLIRVYLTHFFEEILRVGARDIGRPRPTAVTLFRPPRRWFDRFLNAFGHRQKGTGNRPNRNILVAEISINPTYAGAVSAR
jgi:hypothetical protein